MNLKPFNKKSRPPLGTKALILMQRITKSGCYWHRWDVAVYIRNPYDRRKRGWCSALQVAVGDSNPWIHNDVTHWLDLEYLDYLPPEEFVLPEATDAQLSYSNVRRNEEIKKYLE